MYYNFGEYVSVADQRKKAEKLVNKLRKQGADPHPIEAFQGKIAKSFWGKSWCDNLEYYADESYRLDRGRRYVRAGCVCDLAVAGGDVAAVISGSKVYNVKARIAPMAADKWQVLRRKCSNHIGSLIELLKCNISKEVMAIVCDRDIGLFPELDEISFKCSCPDYAVMCKHVAATLYGIGRRLDENPGLLFELRGVDPADLIQIDHALPTFNGAVDKEQLESIFGIDLEMDTVQLEPVITTVEVQSQLAKDINTQNAGTPGAHENPRQGSSEKTVIKILKSRKKATSKKRREPKTKETESAPKKQNLVNNQARKESSLDPNSMFDEEIRKLNELRFEYQRRLERKRVNRE